jgi:hypothetical protein
MQIKYANTANNPPRVNHPLTQPNRVRTLTGKEIELDIESDYKVRYRWAKPHIHRAKRREAPRLSPREHHASTASLFWSTRIGRWHEFACEQVQRIKERVEEKEGIPPQQQRLIYGGKQM